MGRWAELGSEHGVKDSDIYMKKERGRERERERGREGRRDNERDRPRHK